MPKLSSKLLTFLFVILSLFGMFSQPSYAAITDMYKDTQTAIGEGYSSEGWNFNWIYSTPVSLLIGGLGVIPNAVLDGLSYDYKPGGLVGLQTQMIASLYNPPASGVQYLAETWDSFLGKPAYAQNGMGFTGLQPILPIWRGFRNITYILSSIFFIVIGLMVMLRVKISPQAVVTVQNAIPQLVTTLILITFSYAIAGLVIDLMQFFQALVIALLFEVDGKSLGASLLPGIRNYNFEILSTGNLQTVANLTFRAVPLTPLAVLSTIIGTIVAGIVSLNTLNPVAGLGVGASVGGGAFILILFILVVFIIFWMFKFYFGCLKAYVYVIFKIIIAPLELAMGAFPNSKMGFNTWIWDLIANLAVFPVSIIFLTVGNMIIDRAKTGLWAPHIIRDPSFPSVVLGAATLTNVVAVGIGIAVVSLVSKLPEMIPEFIFAIKPSPWSKAIGESVRPENMPLVGGLYKNTSAALGKASGEAVLKAGGAALSRWGIGPKSVQQDEASG